MLVHRLLAQISKVKVLAHWHRRPAGVMPPRRSCWFFPAALLLVLGMAALGSHALAQASTGDWMEPVNLSRSGAASDPVLVPVPNGTLRVLWWDSFEGLMVADGTVHVVPEPTATEDSQPGSDAWSDAAAAPILVPERVVRAGQEAIVPLPIQLMPRIVGDMAGRAHAFWLGKADEETGDQPLLTSRLAPDQTTWSEPLTLAASAAVLDAAADVSGTLQVAYLLPVESGTSPSGLYYRRSEDGGATWTAPTAIYQSRYLRLLPADDSLCLTAGDANNLAVTWQDPRQGQTLIARSTDGGATWEEPRPLLASDATPFGSQVIAVPGQARRLLQSLAGEAGSGLAASSTGDGLALSLWDGERWARVKHLYPDLRDPEMGLVLRLDDLHLAFTVPTPGQEAATGSLAVAGTDPQGDLWITGLELPALTDLLDVTSGSSAQREASAQTGPVNLSRSGAASNPAIVAGPDGSLHAFWWDQFDGLMVADGFVSVSRVTSGTQEFVTLYDSWSESRPVSLPAATTPRIISDAAGRVHAVWVQVAEQQETGERVAEPLLYSQLAPDGASWSSPATLAESALVFDVVADMSGAVHLTYLLTRETLASPAGIYYQRIGRDGAGWTAPVLVHSSRYLRLLTLATAHLRLAAGGTGDIYITWDDARRERSLLVHSSNAGKTWQAPVEVGDPEGKSARGRLLVPPSGEALVLWEPGRAVGACTLYQAPASAVLDGSAGDGQRVLTGLTNCQNGEHFLPLAERRGDGQVLMNAGAGSDALTLALWDGERWSEPVRWSQAFEDVEMGRNVYLGGLHGAVIQIPGAVSDGTSGWALAAIGTDDSGNVWAISSQEGTLGLVFAGPPPWSAPVRVSAGEAYPGLPAIELDSEGITHLLWSESASPEEPGTALYYSRWDDTQWTSPASVLQSPDGKADQPDLIAAGQRLHAVWSGGLSGEVFYSRSFVGDAYTATGWAEPRSLPAPVGVASWPDLVAGPDGSLHVVYAVPVNEGRGIYYTSSSDEGQTWLDSRQIFDAEGAGWTVADYPRVAVDLAGLLHVVWVRASLPDAGPPQGIYYARSADGGITWTEPVEMVGTGNGWPQVVAAAPGQVHLTWGGWNRAEPAWHCWSSDGGATWSRPEWAPGLRELTAPADLVADGAGTVYLVGLQGDGTGKAALVYVRWRNGQWDEQESYPIDLSGHERGIVAALVPELGRLDVVFRALDESAEDTPPMAVWHMQRSVPEVGETPVPAWTPLPATSPEPGPTEPAPTDAPASLSEEAPAATNDTSLPVPLLLSAGVAAAVVVGVIGARLMRLGRGREW